MVSQKEIIEELRGECNGCKRDMLADRIEAEGIAPKPYVPMTDDEILELVRFFTTLGFPISRYTKRIESAVIKRAGLNVANQCSYPNCLDNEDERCPKWLTGKCKRAGLEIKHD